MFTTVPKQLIKRRAPVKRRQVPKRRKAQVSQRAPRPSPMVGVAFNRTNRSYSTPTTHRLVGTDQVLRITAPVHLAGAAVRIPCNPRLWPNTRAYQESLGWQTYIPHAITVKWNPGVPTTTAGQIFAGSLNKSQSVSYELVSNALRSVPGSKAAPVWQEFMAKMDLSALTQPKYSLGAVDVTGAPVDMFLVLPSTAVGSLEVIYDITCYGACTAPVDQPIYDIVPRSVTCPGSTDSSAFVLGSVTGLVTKNLYTITWATAPALAAQPQASNVASAAGSVTIDTQYFNSTTPVNSGTVANPTYMTLLENGVACYLYNAAAVNLVTYGWLSGNAS